jgi:HSP20 family protein
MAKRTKTALHGEVERKAAKRGKTAQPKKAEPVTALVPREPERSTPATPSRRPFALMRRFAEEMDRLFDDLRLGASSLFPRLEFPFERRDLVEAAWMPPVEVIERGDKLVVRADLPGLSKDDVKVEVREDALCISGERRQEREEERKGFYRSERSYGSFYREVALPQGIDIDQTKAAFRNGVLEVTLPAPPKPAKGRQIPIEES